MKRILVFGMTENPGGIETFLYGYYSKINKKKIQFDFLCNSYNKIAYEDKLVDMGARCFHITARSQNFLKYKKDLKRIFDKYSKEWDAIWVNVCSLANIDYLKIAQKYNIKKRIIHSHNSQNMDSRLRMLLHNKNKKIVERYATDFWACSMDSAQWFYKDKVLDKVKIVNNAIDINKMKFDEKQRHILRTKMKMKEKFVIGNIGRFHFQKNQLFVLEVFKEYLNINKEAVLVLIGQGEDKKKIIDKINALKIEDKVILPGIQNNISNWLSSFDLFLFPSLFEGLSIAALEAQANGIPVLASSQAIPNEVKINDNFNFFELEKDVKLWALQIDYIQKNLKREEFKNIRDNFNAKGYNLELEINKFENLLLG